ncbi:MAG: MFS transporter, partial [Streptomycetaceae bacterium]|nr:MFS transporter [Streptomycetaceae bacterium]
AGFAGEVGGVRAAFAVAGAGAVLGLALLVAGRRTLAAPMIHAAGITARELSRNSTSPA